ncbi:NTP transferase domain-containing protein [Candidatus Desantisbacteria bacterium]|nr:NTP transferase domain-containing protein [Candidatus Desantisbacteria bacterium]
MDTIILAGDQKKNIKINDDNKAFLLLEQKPVIIHVLKTLLFHPEIDNIYVVGPKERLDKTLKAYEYELNSSSKKIFTIEQKKSLLENVLEGFYCSIPEYNNKTLSIEQIKIKYIDKAALFLPGDIPLVMPEEISFFISNCDLKKYDYFIGITPENVMETYYPETQSPGIIMAYMHFKEGRYRVSNIHLARLFKLNELKYFAQIYNIRYQKKIKNIYRFIKYVSDAPDTFKIYKYYLCMQIALFFNNFKLKLFSDFFRKFVPINEVETILSNIINAKLKTIIIPFGGIAVDIDNEKDFAALQSMFNKWIKKQRDFFEKKAPKL